VEKRLADEQERLRRIEARLRQIELEDKMPTRSVRLASCITYSWQKFVELSSVYIN